VQDLWQYQLADLVLPRLWYPQEVFRCWLAEQVLALDCQWAKVQELAPVKDLAWVE
jgi:hypothetical protein